jgi:hypothetical protein
MSRAARLALAVASLVAAAPADLAAQRDTVVVAGPRYRASGIKRFLFGSSYRNLWTAPVRVPVLDLGSYGGGLTVTGTGGGRQTPSLRFRSADGRQFAFRLVDKEPTAEMHRDMQGTWISAVVQDQVSSLVPAGGIPAHALEASAGIPHSREHLFVLPDDPRLGEHRERFARRLGTLEQRFDEQNPAVVPGADRLVEYDSLLAELGRGPSQRFDDRGYLAVRLVDLVLGDWDRHSDQYRWARVPEDAGHRWVTVPRDRDYAFSDYDGLLPALLHSQVKNALRYRPRIELGGLLVNSAPLDRRLLGGVPRAAWDSVTRAVQARLTDAAIDSAMATLPPEWTRLEGTSLAAVVRARRDDLPRASTALYKIVTLEAEAHGTDRGDAATIERLSNGDVRVTLASAAGGAPYYDRVFDWRETREVRVYLHGGDDRARVTGAGYEQVIVRVIGGAGDDLLADEGKDGRHTAFYDSVGNNRYERRPRTRVDERPWTEVTWKPDGGTAPVRDWGASASAFTPDGGWRGGGGGPWIGFGPTWKRYGFRRAPYATEQRLRFMWLLEHGRYGAEYEGDFHAVGRPGNHTQVLVRVSEMETSRFYGFGNNTLTGGQPSEHFTVFERQLMADVERWQGIGRGAWLVGGLTARYTDPEAEAGTPLVADQPRGVNEWMAGGGRLGLVLDRADTLAFRRWGWAFEVMGRAFPLVHRDAEAFGGARAVATAYLSPLDGGPTLALRAGGERMWGEFPFPYAAYLGGSHALRGYDSERFAGDAAAHGSAELRQPLFRANLLVMRGTLGAIALGDAGRVWYQGDSPGDWHTAYGGGIFFTWMDHRSAASIVYAYGEQGKVYFQLGLPF